MSIKPLDQNTIRHLNSGQGIISIESIVKELIENSIDAGATLIDLLFIENGLESIQIKDNGSGIHESDRSLLAKRYYTSKLSEFNDLENVLTFGFRGEAMNSICSISQNVVLTTKTNQDPIGKQYDLDQEGSLSNPKPSSLVPSNGTLIQLYRPFYKLPVRRQLAYKNASQNMKKMHQVIIKYALPYPNIRFSYQTKSVLNQQQSSWIKPVTKSIESAISIIYCAQLSNMLESFIETDESLTIHLIIPKANSDPTVIYKEDCIFVYVNQRPINYVQSELKDAVALIKNRYRQVIGLSENNKKNPFIYLDIQLPPSEYDVNVEPSKSTILFHNKQLVYNLVEKVVDHVYPTKIEKFFNVQTQKQVRRLVTHDPEDLEEEEPLFMTLNNSQQYPGGIKDVSQSRAHQGERENAPSFVEEQLEDEPPSRNHQENEETSPSFITEQLENGLPSHTRQESEESFPSFIAEQLEEASCIHQENEETSPSSIVVEQFEDSKDEVPNNEELLDETMPSPRSSSPIPTMDRSFTFSMASDDEDEDIDAFEHASFTQNVISLNTNPAIKRTLLDHWQVRSGDTQPTTQVLPSKPVRVSSSSSPPPPPTIHHEPHPVHSSFDFAASGPSKQGLPAVQHTPPPSKRPLEQGEHHAVTKKLKAMRVSGGNTRYQDTNTKGLSTLNQTQTITCCSLSTMKANYEKYTDRSRVRVGDYLLKGKGGPITSLMRVPKLNKYDALLYTRGKKDAEMNEIGVVKLKLLQANTIFLELMKDHKLICKTSLTRPVQMQLNSEDVLCPILFSLACKEVYIKDDLHGNQNITFSEIIDNRVLHNGFRGRWRKDPYSNEIVVQLTAIYSLGSVVYGPPDFRELLTALHDDDNRRPKKVEEYLWTLAHDMGKTQREQDHDCIPRQLEELEWNQDEDWKIGYSKTGQMIACKKD